MRLLCIMHDAYVDLGGLAKFNRDILATLSADDRVAEIVLLAQNPGEAGAALPEKVVVARRPTFGRAGFLLAAAGVFAAPGRIDAIFCQHINLAPIALALHHRSGAPISLFIHGIDAWQPPAPALTRFAANRVHHVVSVSAFTLARFRGWSRTAAAGHILPNCVDFDQFTPGPPDAATRDRLDLKGRKVLMTLARLVAGERYKGIDEILAILSQLRARQPDLIFVIAGVGDDLPRLQAVARDLGIEAHVRFTGYVPEDEKADLYRLADAFTLCGSGEGFGIVLLEAMACGVPAIASMRDGSAEAVADGAFGQVADPEDLQSLARSVHAALAQGAGRRPEGLERFSEDAFRNRVGTLLGVLTSGRR